MATLVGRSHCPSVVICLILPSRAQSHSSISPERLCIYRHIAHVRLELLSDCWLTHLPTGVEGERRDDLTDEPIIRRLGRCAQIAIKLTARLFEFES